MRAFVFTAFVCILFAFKAGATEFKPPSEALAKSDLANAFLEKVRIGMNEMQVHSALKDQEEAIGHSEIQFIFSFYGWFPLQLVHDGDSYSFWLTPPQSPSLPKNIMPITIFGTVKFDDLPHSSATQSSVARSALIDFLQGRRKGTLLEFTISYPIPERNGKPGRFTRIYFYDGPNMQKKPIGQSDNFVYLGDNITSGRK